MYAEGYLNDEDVLKALGAKVNYTDSTLTVVNGAFFSLLSQ